VDNKPIHLHTNRLQSDINILLLLIPGIIYILTLGLFLWGFQKRQEKRQIAGTHETTILGEEDNLDNSYLNIAK